MGNKVLTLPALRKKVSALKKQKKTIVFTNGCFDLLHAGHVRLFKKARSYGDALIVAINSDASLRRLKGPGRPLVGQKDRAELLSALEPVDIVTVFDEDTPARVISALRPDVLVKGGDYAIDQIVGRESVQRVVRFPTVKGRSTSSLIQKIVKHYGK